MTRLEDQEYKETSSFYYVINYCQKGLGRFELLGATKSSEAGPIKNVTGRYAFE